LKLLTSILKSL